MLCFTAEGNERLVFTAYSMRGLSLVSQRAVHWDSFCSLSFSVFTSSPASGPSCCVRTAEGKDRVGVRFYPIRHLRGIWTFVLCFHGRGKGPSELSPWAIVLCFGIISLTYKLLKKYVTTFGQVFWELVRLIALEAAALLLKVDRVE